MRPTKETTDVAAARPCYSESVANSVHGVYVTRTIKIYGYFTIYY